MLWNVGKVFNHCESCYQAVQKDIAFTANTNPYLLGSRISREHELFFPLRTIYYVPLTSCAALSAVADWARAVAVVAPGPRLGFPILCQTALGSLKSKSSSTTHFFQGVWCPDQRVVSPDRPL